MSGRDQLGHPCLHVAMLDPREICIPPTGQHMSAEHGLVERAGCRLQANLSVDPLRGQVADRDTGTGRVDIAAGLHRSRHTVQPRLCIDLALKVPGVFLALDVPVSGSPVAVWSFCNACHGGPPAGWAGYGTVLT